MKIAFPKRGKQFWFAAAAAPAGFPACRRGVRQRIFTEAQASPIGKCAEAACIVWARRALRILRDTVGIDLSEENQLRWPFVLSGFPACRLGLRPAGLLQACPFRLHGKGLKLPALSGCIVLYEFSGMRR